MAVLRAILRTPLVVARAAGGGGRGVLRGLWRGGRQLVRRSSGPGAPGRRVTLNALAWVAAVVFALIGFGTAGNVYDVASIGLGVTPFIGAMAGLPLGLVTWRPMTGWAVSLVSAFGFAVMLPVFDGDPWPWAIAHGIVLLALLFAVCARERLRRAVGAWFLTALLFAWGVPEDISAGWMVAVTTVAVMGVLAGRLARTRVALAEQEEVTSAEKARRVVLEERTRIARDLHDIVAHHMSLVVVQAETAPYRVADLTDGARQELASISASARSALAETRALLSVLRQDGDGPEHAPQPGLEELDALVESARRAGVRVTAYVRRAVEGLRPGAALAAFRIVQEALANAARHAPGAQVTVEVARVDDTLRLAVVNGPVPGHAGMPVAPAVPGHGITGMRERATAEGGTLVAGRTDGGGFAVRAALPLGASATSDAASTPGGVGVPGRVEAPGRAVPQERSEGALP